jgi:hypothetical protein
MKDNTEVIEAGAGSTAGGQAVTHEIELEDGAQPGPNQEAKTQAVRNKSARRATGPRTESGKAISRKNALKFGIFSKELVISSDISLIPAKRKKTSGACFSHM